MNQLLPISKSQSLRSESSRSRQSEKMSSDQNSMTSPAQTPSSRSDKVENPSTNQVSRSSNEKIVQVDSKPEEKWMKIKRRVYTQAELDARYPDISPPEVPGLLTSCRCTRDKVVGHVTSLFPIISVVRGYEWRFQLLPDITAGVSTSFLQMPMGMSLALLANLPPIIGLYSSFFPPLLYLVFGTSRHICMGTQALISLLTAGIIHRKLEEKRLQTGSLTADEEEIYKIGVANTVALICGFILIAMGALRLGFITTYLSSSFLGGFTEAAAVHIVTSQIPPLFNIQISPQSGSFKIVRYYQDISAHLQNINGVDAAIGILSIIILLVVGHLNVKYQNKMTIPIPIHLILVVVSTIASTYARLREEYKVQVVGNVPVGFMTPSFPPTADIGDIFQESFIVAIMIFALTIAMAKLMSKQHNYQIDDNQEILAYGLCNFVSAIFRCQPNCTAPPRTMLLGLCGVKTTLNSLFLAMVLGLIILAAGPLFSQLPVSVLAAMIIATTKGLLMQFLQLPSLWRVSKPDFIVWVVTCLVGVIVDLDVAIVVGILVSVLSVVVFSQVTSSTVDGASTSEHVIIHNHDRQGTSTFQDVAIFYFPSPLYFATADKFKKDLFGKVLNPDDFIDHHALLRRKSRHTLDVRYFYNDEVHFFKSSKFYGKWHSERRESNQSVFGDGEDPIRNSGLMSPTLLQSPVGSLTENTTPGLHEQRPNNSRDTTRRKSLAFAESKQTNNSLESHLSSSNKSSTGSMVLLKAIVVDCSAMTYIDLAGVNVLELVMSKYDDIGIKLYLADCPPYFLHTLKKAKFFDVTPYDSVVFKVDDALFKCGSEEIDEQLCLLNNQFDDAPTYQVIDE